MANLGHTLAVYLRLAIASESRRRPHACDRFLLLAGVAAVELEYDAISAGCRTLLLAHNPQHLIRRWPTLEAALANEDFLCLLKQVRRRCPRKRRSNCYNRWTSTWGVNARTICRTWNTRRLS